MTGQLPWHSATLPYRECDYYVLRPSPLLSFAKRGTQILVTNSYLGIITKRGLERLVLETEHAALFLLRRVARLPFGSAIAFWAVLDDNTARLVTTLVAARHFQAALHQLDTRALHLGSLLPPLSEEGFQHTGS